MYRLCVLSLVFMFACSPSKKDDSPAASGSMALPQPDLPRSGVLDFEQISSLDNLSDWQTSAPNCKGTGRLSLDTSFAHGGTSSLRIDGQGGYCNHIFLGLKAPVWSNQDTLYVRFFVALDKPLTDSHITLVTLHDQVENKDLRLGGQAKILMWNRESDDATLPELSPQGIAQSVSFLPRRWYCVSFTIDPKQGTLATRVDDAVVNGLQVDAVPTPDIDAQWLRKTGYRPQPIDLKLGYESYGGDANTLWYDDLQIALGPLNCT